MDALHFHSKLLRATDIDSDPTLHGGASINIEACIFQGKPYLWAECAKKRPYDSYIKIPLLIVSQTKTETCSQRLLLVIGEHWLPECVNSLSCIDGGSGQFLV